MTGRGHFIQQNMHNRTKSTKKTAQKVQSYRLPPDSQNSEQLLQYHTRKYYECLFAFNSIMIVDSRTLHLNSTRKLQNGICIVNQYEIPSPLIKFPTQKPMDQFKHQPQVPELISLKAYNKIELASQQMVKQHSEGVGNGKRQPERQISTLKEQNNLQNGQKGAQIETLKTGTKPTEYMDAQN